MIFFFFLSFFCSIFVIRSNWQDFYISLACMQLLLWSNNAPDPPIRLSYNTLNVFICLLVGCWLEKLQVHLCYNIWIDLDCVYFKLFFGLRAHGLRISLNNWLVIFMKINHHLRTRTYWFDVDKKNKPDQKTNACIKQNIQHKQVVDWINNIFFFEHAI